MAIPSVTGSEREVGEFLASHLASLGYRVERQPVTGDRFNVFAFAGEGRVMFCTHLDTVPPATIPVREDDDFLYGRGACDTKGIIAAMLEAGDRLRRRRDHELRLHVSCCRGNRQHRRQDSEHAAMEVRVRDRRRADRNQLARAQKGTLMVNLSVDRARGAFGLSGTWAFPRSRI